MKHVISVACLLLFLCSCTENKENRLVENLQFPYEDFVSFDDDGFLVIGDDGNGFAAISHKIQYLQVDDTLRLTQFADSLLQFYNVYLSYNSIIYDFGTACMFEDDEGDAGKSQAKALYNINVSGISDAKIRKGVRDLGRKMAYGIMYYRNKKEYVDVQEYIDANNAFDEAFKTLYGPLLEEHQREWLLYYDPTTIMEDYQSIHEKAINDTLGYRNELLQQVIQEKDFEKACVLAREFAYANYISEDQNDEELVSLLEPLLQAGQYSPLLGELWLMWRTALQPLLGGMSNTSSMYNLLYNDMRNRVALAYLTHLNAHPQDELAFQEFISLAACWNIVRNSGCLVGNNVLFDEVKLYKNDVAD